MPESIFHIAVLEPANDGLLRPLIGKTEQFEVFSVHSVADLLDRAGHFDVAVVDPELDGYWPASVAAQLVEALNERLILCCRSAVDAAILRQRFNDTTILEPPLTELQPLITLFHAKLVKARHSSTVVID